MDSATESSNMKALIYRLIASHQGDTINEHELNKICTEFKGEHRNNMTNLILKKVSTDSTQVSYADMTSSPSEESNQINVERDTYLTDSYEVANEMKIYNTINDNIKMNEEGNLQHNSQEEDQENMVRSSIFSPYGAWAEKRRQACERQKNQQMERERKMQERVEKRRNQLKEEVKKELKNVDTVMAMKQKAGLNEVSSVTSSTSSPYGAWAEKRRQACERQKNQQMDRERKMQERVEKRRNQLKEEVKKEMKNVDTVMAMKQKAGLNEVSSVTSSTCSPYGAWAEKRKQACYLQSLQKTKMMDRERKMQDRLEEYRNRLKEELIREIKNSAPRRDELHRVESRCEENAVSLRNYMHQVESRCK